MSVRDVIIVGAGPSGLAAAIAARKHDLEYEVIEQGVLVDSIFRFPSQMVFFTTPELLEIGGLPFVSPHEKPTRHEALKYYRRVADAHQLPVTLGQRVTEIVPPPARTDPAASFTIKTTSTAGQEIAYRARAVVVAT